jgi:hypothetical protein
MSSCCGVLAALETHGLTGAPICCAADRAIFLVRCDLDESMGLGCTPGGYEVIYWRSLSELLDARAGLAHAGVWLVEPVCGPAGLPLAEEVLTALWKASFAGLGDAVDGIGVAVFDFEARTTMEPTAFRNLTSSRKPLVTTLAAEPKVVVS